MPRRRPHTESRLDHRGGGELDARVDVRLARLAEREWGVLSTDELRRCGLSDRQIDRRVATGRLHRRHRGVFVLGHDNAPLQARFLAAVKACGADALLSHVAAAVLHDLMAWDHRPVDVTVAGRGTRLHAGVRAHRTSCLDDRDRSRVQGIPVTSVTRTLVDCAAQLDERDLRRLVREAQAQGLVELPELSAMLLRLAPRRGSRRLARIITTGPAPTRSQLEDVVLDLILGGGLLHPDVNVPLEVGGRRVVPDFRWPRARLVVEADGAAWHDHRLAREDDAMRQALLEAHGERVVRVTWDQALERPGQTLERVRAAGAPAADAEPAASVDLPTATVDNSTLGAPGRVRAAHAE